MISLPTLILIWKMGDDIFLVTHSLTFCNALHFLFSFLFSLAACQEEVQKTRDLNE